MPPPTDPPAAPPGQRDRSSLLAVVLLYAVFASLWILLSDSAVELIVREPARLTQISMLKGWLFVGVTSLLLYSLLLRMDGHALRAPPGEKAPAQSHLPLVLLGLFIAALTLAGIVQSLQNRKAAATAELFAIADFKSRQIADWLNERQADAELLHAGQVFETARRHGAPAATAPHARLAHLIKPSAFRSVTLLDARDRPVWHSAGTPLQLTSETRAAIARARARHAAVQTGLYAGADGQIFLDHVVRCRTAPIRHPSPSCASTRPTG